MYHGNQISNDMKLRHWKENFISFYYYVQKKKIIETFVQFCMLLL